MVSLSIDPPPSPGRSRSFRSAPRLVAVLLAVGAVFGGGFLVGRASGVRAEATRPARVSARSGAAPSPKPEPTAATAPRTLAAPPVSSDANGAPKPAPAAAAPVPPGMRLLRVDVAGPVEDSIAASLPQAERALAGEVTAVVNRLLVWDMNVARDARRGDRLDVLWTEPPQSSHSRVPVIEAMRYESQKLGSTIAAYRFQAGGARWPRYYRADGAEVEQRLADPPVADYEQITSLLRDGRRHKGVDFKMPVGSPVRATFDGVVERRNWNFAGNGNCLDVRDIATGRHAIFLHLDALPKDLRAGRRVHKGDVIAASGNSGHSFAPHLHYQLEAPDGRVLDPFDVHRTERVAIAERDRAPFAAARAKLDAAMAR